jgi:integrase
MRIGEFSGLQWGDIDFSKKKIHISRSLSTAYFDGKKVMELTTPKTGNSYRDIPFFGDCERLLLDWRNKQNIYKAKLGKRWRADEELGDLVFTTTMGSPITRYNIVHDMKRVEANIRMKENTRAYIEGREPRYFEHIHPHCMRHTFATRCFEKGLDPLVIQSIMGHSNYSTTISYTHILQDKTDEAVKKAGDLLN